MIGLQGDEWSEHDAYEPRIQVYTNFSFGRGRKRRSLVARYAGEKKSYYRREFDLWEASPARKRSLAIWKGTQERETLPFHANRFSPPAANSREHLLYFQPPPNVTHSLTRYPLIDYPPLLSPLFSKTALVSFPPNIPNFSPFEEEEDSSNRAQQRKKIVRVFYLYLDLDAFRCRWREKEREEMVSVKKIFMYISEVFDYIEMFERFWLHILFLELYISKEEIISFEEVKCLENFFEFVPSSFDSWKRCGARRKASSSIPFHFIRFIVIFLARKGNVNVSFLDLAKDESESLSILIPLGCNKCKDRAKLSLDVRKDPPLPLKIIIQLLVIVRS